MSTAVFQYSEMSTAARRAKDTAKRLSDYSDGLRRRVCEKLDSYSGSRTSNIYRADRELESKRRHLEQRSEDLARYGENMEQLVSSCKDTDQKVEQMVSDLTGEFKTRHGIGTNPVWESLCSAITWAKNETAVGRFLSGLWEKGTNALDEAWDNLKFWYKYDGGKYYLTENIKALLGIVGGIIGVAAGIATLIAGGAPLAIAGAIAGVVAGIFAIGNGIVNMINNHRAGAMAAENPGMAQRTDEIESGADWLRTTDNKWAHGAATVLDMTETAATVISFVSGGYELVKKGYSFLTSSKNLDLDTLTLSTMKDGLKNGQWKTFAADRWAEIKGGVRNFAHAVKVQDAAEIKQTMRTAYTALKENFVSPHADAWKDIKAISQKHDAKTIASSLEGVRHFTSLMEDFISDPSGTILDNTVLNSLATGGENSISLSDLWSQISDGGDIAESIWDIWDKSTQGDIGAVTRRLSWWRNRAGGVRPATAY